MADLTTVTPASILRDAADELTDLGGEVSGGFLSALIAMHADPADPTGELRASTAFVLAIHNNQASLHGWLPAGQPLPACVVAGIMRTAAAALEVAG